MSKEEKNFECVKCELFIICLLFWVRDIDLGVIIVYMYLKTWDWMKLFGKGREDSLDKFFGYFNIERLGVGEGLIKEIEKEGLVYYRIRKVWRGKCF